MRYQLHHQPKDYNRSGETIFISQSEEITSAATYDKWLADNRKANPLPEGYQWLVCNEKSEYFECTFNNDSLVERK
ncbi:MAG: hypothetical protein MUO31_06565 [Thermodesulfovibrionales bacterium]|nr:hypothetical protein [Thermodesulfovibrionales bacterium]